MTTQEKNKKYSILVVCRNCSYGHADMSMNDGEKIRIEKGKTVAKTPCPKCGCKELVSLNKK